MNIGKKQLLILGLVVVVGGVAFAAGQIFTTPQTPGEQVVAALEKTGVTSINIGPFSFSPKGIGKAVDETGQAFNDIANEFQRARAIAKWRAARLELLQGIILDPSQMAKLSQETRVMAILAAGFLIGELNQSGAGISRAAKKRGKQIDAYIASNKKVLLEGVGGSNSPIYEKLQEEALYTALNSYSWSFPFPPPSTP